MDDPTEMKGEHLETPTSKHCISSESEDRLSTLLEDLCWHIISFLPMEDAVRTSTLSWKWRQTCYSLPNLIFDFDRLPASENKLEEFKALIDQVIAHHDESNIKNFAIKFWPEDESSFCLNNAWITFAMQRNVENLTLMMQIAEPQLLPSCLFNSKSLKKLHLALFDYVLNVPTQIDLPNLKELTLTGVVIADDESVRILFLTCPALETLSIEICDLHHVLILDMYAPNLQHLEMIESDLFSLKKLSVSKSNLNRLKICKCFGLRKCEIHIRTPDLTVAI